MLEDVRQMTRVMLMDEVKRLRTAIRQHRDQEGDQRCQLDDDLLYEVLPEGKPTGERKLPCNFLEGCKAFFEHRQNRPFKSVEELYAGWNENRPYLSHTEVKALLNILLYARDQFSNNSCNDMWLPNTDENWELYESYLKWMKTEYDGIDETEPRPPLNEKILFSDSSLCEYFMNKLKGML